MFSIHACPIATREGKETGGLQVYVLELSKALGLLGYHVDIFTRKERSDNPDIADVAPNVRVIHVPMGPLRPIGKKQLIPYLDDFVRNFRRITSQHALTYDAIHCHYYISGLAGLACRKHCGKAIPLIITFHTLGLMKNLVARSESEQDHDSRIAAERQIIEEFNAVVASSTIDAEYLRYLYSVPNQKLSVIRPGVDTALFHTEDQRQAKKRIGADPNHRIILSIGRIEPLKGFDVLLYAMKILLSRRPEWLSDTCLYIVGGNSHQTRKQWSTEQRKLDRVRTLLGLEAVVKFIPQQPQEALPSYYNAAEILVMPSHYESFGMVALEALACSTPVIASNVSGVSRLLRRSNGTAITSANNPLLLAEQIDRILSENVIKKTPPERQPFPYTWRKTAEDSARLYDTLAG